MGDVLMKYRLTNHHSWLQAVLVVICSAWLSVAAAQTTSPPTQRDNKSVVAPVDKQAGDNKATDKKDEAAPRPDKPSYFLASQVDWVPLLAPPPAVNSPEQQRDLQTVLDAQAANRKGSARREIAVADTEASCFRIVYAVDPKLDAKQVPKAAEFLKKAASEGDDATGVLKNYWQRARPFVVSDKVERLGDIDPENIKKKQQEQKEKEKNKKDKDARRNAGPRGRGPGNGPNNDGMPGPPDVASAASTDNADKKLSPEEQEKKKLDEQKRQLEYSSYPSGHSTYGTLCAIFLSEMLPEKQAEIFKRADEYRQSRLIVGAHFPSDVEAGRIVATTAAAVMSQNFAFQRDLATARIELRTALGLPAELPTREKTATKNPQP
jgi:hypothetical protein